jgi:hypothetical protein
MKILARHNKINPHGISRFKLGGFSALELTFVLFFIGFLIITSNQLLANISSIRETNQVADQAKMLEQAAIRYVTDNYYQIVQHEGNQVINYQDISRYLPTGSNLNIFTKYYQIPCLQIKSDENKRVWVYLFFWNSTRTNQQSLTQLNLSKIANTIGGNAAVLEKADDGYVVKSNFENQLSFSNSEINELANACHINQDTITKYSLFVDVSKNKDLVRQIITYQRKSPTEESDVTDASLKKNQSDYLATMNTDLYMDSVIRESSESLTVKHRYSGLDFDNNNGNRVQVVSHVNSDDVSYQSQLDINHAGLQAGYIAPMSHLIKLGENCSESELGKMAQQNSDSIIAVGGQLQCTYNPTFCEPGSYCYLAVKSSTFIIKYVPTTTAGSCPTGTLVTAEQPADGLDASVKCPTIPGYSMVDGKVIGENIGCRQSITHMNLCNSYQSVCRYRDYLGAIKEMQIPALTKLECSSRTNTFVVDNYRPESDSNENNWSDD